MSRHNLWISVDNYKRKLFLKHEIKKQLLISNKKNKNSTYLARYKSSFYLSMLPQLSSKIQVNNRCVFTGRVWSVNRKTGYTRFVMRDESYKSNLPGIRRASW